MEEYLELQKAISSGKKTSITEEELGVLNWGHWLKTYFIPTLR